MTRDQKNAKARQKLIDDPVGERARRAEQARKWRARHPEKARSYGRIRNGVVMEPSPEDIIFYGYKEPLRKFEGGFGYQGVLMYSKDKDRVQCHFCGLLFRTINNGHLKKVHNLTAAQYKEKTGLKPSTALIGEGTRVKLLDRGFNPNHMEELRKAQEQRRLRKALGLPDLQGARKMRLERKNERGTCPDQLLDIIQKTVDSFGRVPTGEEFLSFHHGKYMGSIRNTFGTWTNAIQKLGLKTHFQEGISRESLTEALKNFYSVHKRTARWSDFRRGLLPQPYAYYKKFKSLNHARLLAQVPLIIEIGHRKREEWMPTEVERQKLLAQYQ